MHAKSTRKFSPASIRSSPARTTGSFSRSELPGEIDAIIGSILREGGKIDSVTPVKMTLEEIFLRELQEGK